MLVLYDGVCGLCDRGVQWLIRHDRNHRLIYAPLQGNTARPFLARHGIGTDLETMVLVIGAQTDQEQVLVRSDAWLRILAELGGVWRVLGWGRVLPRGLRDAVYRWVARNRYRWFGQFDTCRIPASEQAELFLD